MKAIKLFSSYTKADNSTRYVVVLQDNTIWWYMPNQPWQQSTSEGLPPHLNIKHLVAYAKGNDTRYVVVLEDNTIWWYMPNQIWQQSSVEGLPQGYQIKIFDVYLKEGNQTRYVVVLQDNSIWWYMPNQPWFASSLEGLEEKIVENDNGSENSPTISNDSDEQVASGDNTL